MVKGQEQSHTGLNLNVTLADLKWDEIRLEQIKFKKKVQKFIN